MLMVQKLNVWIFWRIKWEVYSEKGYAVCRKCGITSLLFSRRFDTKEVVDNKNKQLVTPEEDTVPQCRNVDQIVNLDFSHLRLDISQTIFLEITGR